MSPGCPHHQVHPCPAVWALLPWSLGTAMSGHSVTPPSPSPAHHGGAAGMQANACPAREPHTSRSSWWPVVARGGPWPWDMLDLPRVSTRWSQNATNRGHGTVMAAHHCGVGAPGHATPQPCGAKGGLPPLHVACKANLAGNPSHSRHTPWGENPHVCPSMGWLGGAWNPCPEGAIPCCQLCPPAQLPVT